ncbi:hypothetical protein M406DRAFT_325531 [Cryphonectria parasitica EP155]|uniref:Uncharacterized protein n=1 Tax=Cryphonectria parasitica (strain ATCC 38755 / EP155) TaxID=660469 RepID=A0A9P5CTU6_CRYP1|nr:uncharacterized protein M406DRAFT_325531 [Cryphonectria parasitica EP155]KAF3770057.1 hypothetical protein M406DRAFT_325531 [Cryphonectria parasitica EP155]
MLPSDFLPFRLFFWLLWLPTSLSEGPEAEEAGLGAAAGDAGDCAGSGGGWAAATVGAEEEAAVGVGMSRCPQRWGRMMVVAPEPGRSSLAGASGSVPPKRMASPPKAADSAVDAAVIIIVIIFFSISGQYMFSSR